WMGEEPVHCALLRLSHAVPAVEGKLPFKQRPAQIAPQPTPATDSRKRPSGCPNGLSCLTAAPTLKRAISKPPCRGPISRRRPDRGPLLIGAVAIPLPDPSRWFPISVR